MYSFVSKKMGLIKRNMSIIKKRYDENYFENIFYKEAPCSQRNRNRLKEILKHKERGKLLEVGCGKGELLKLTANHFDIEGMDISEYAINTIRPALGCKVSVQNIEKANLRPNHYDAIVVFNLLEHTKKPQLVVQKLHRSLRNRGVLIGSVPNNTGLLGRIATQLYNLIDRTHCSTHPPNYWHALFQDIGFEEIFLFGEVTLGRNNNVYITNRLWKYLSSILMFVCKK